ncbi:hypothetical protein [Telluria beijingensis]|uniref:hypothetical protein n=1 Tax=Telluria beijingensis TaxID=3068633 RepID=UPI002795494B|nr:hypothetical protein [Massilia sp. REN29]
MQVSQIDRRGAAPTDMADATAVNSAVNTPSNPYAGATHVVRQGILVQASLGTRSAVEFLKQHGVHGAVIHRVLMGENVRGDDQAALDDRVAIDDPRM